MCESVKHFENDQFLVIWNCEGYENCDNDRSNTKKSAIIMAKNRLISEFIKCKNRFPKDYMKHTLLGAKVYDNLNRWNYYYHLVIDKDGEIETKKQKI